MTEETNEKDASGIRVIARAVAVLRALRDQQGGMSLGQIAKKVELPRSTVQRIVGALAAERLVIIAGKTGGVQLGPELGAFAEAASFNIVERYRTILKEVVHETGETTDLAVLRENKMVFLDQAPGRHRLRTVSSVGESFPLSVTANGRACLALMTDHEAMTLVKHEWQDLGLHGDTEEILATLEEIRKTGFAYDLDEHSRGISAIGFGFSDWLGNLHAISVPVPSVRFESVREGIEAALKGAKERVEETFSAVI